MIEHDAEKEKFHFTGDAAIGLKLGMLLHLYEVLNNKSVRVLVLTDTSRQLLIDLTYSVIENMKKTYKKK